MPTSFSTNFAPVTIHRSIQYNTDPEHYSTTSSSKASAPSTPAPLHPSSERRLPPNRIQRTIQRLEHSACEYEQHRTLSQLFDACDHSINLWKESSVDQLVKQFEEASRQTHNRLSSDSSSSLLTIRAKQSLSREVSRERIQSRPNQKNKAMERVPTKSTANQAQSQIVGQERLKPQQQSPDRPSSLWRNMFGLSQTSISKPESSQVDAQGNIQKLDLKPVSSQGSTARHNLEHVPDTTPVPNETDNNAIEPKRSAEDSPPNTIVPADDQPPQPPANTETDETNSTTPPQVNTIPSEFPSPQTVGTKPATANQLQGTTDDRKQSSSTIPPSEPSRHRSRSQTLPMGEPDDSYEEDSPAALQPEAPRQESQSPVPNSDEERDGLDVPQTVPSQQGSRSHLSVAEEPRVDDNRDHVPTSSQPMSSPQESRTHSLATESSDVHDNQADEPAYQTGSSRQGSQSQAPNDGNKKDDPAVSQLGPSQQTSRSHSLATQSLNVDDNQDDLPTHQNGPSRQESRSHVPNNGDNPMLLPTGPSPLSQAPDSSDRNVNPTGSQSRSSRQGSRSLSLAPEDPNTNDNQDSPPVSQTGPSRRGSRSQAPNGDKRDMPIVAETVPSRQGSSSYSVSSANSDNKLDLTEPQTGASRQGSQTLAPNSLNNNDDQDGLPVNRTEASQQGSRSHSLAPENTNSTGIEDDLPVSQTGASRQGSKSHALTPENAKIDNNQDDLPVNEPSQQGSRSYSLTPGNGDKKTVPTMPRTEVSRQGSSSYALALENQDINNNQDDLPVVDEPSRQASQSHPLAPESLSFNDNHNDSPVNQASLPRPDLQPQVPNNDREKAGPMISQPKVQPQILQSQAPNVDRDQVDQAVVGTEPSRQGSQSQPLALRDLKNDHNGDNQTMPQIETSQPALQSRIPDSDHKQSDLAMSQGEPFQQEPPQQLLAPEIRVLTSSSLPTEASTSVNRNLEVASAQPIDIPIAPQNSPALPGLKLQEALTTQALQNSAKNLHKVSNAADVGALPAIPQAGLPQLGSVPSIPISTRSKASKRRRLVRRARKVLVRRRILHLMLGRELGQATYAQLGRTQGIAESANLPTGL